MSLILKNGAVFLHIPKTGGNWVTKMLQEMDLIDKSVSSKHADIEHFFNPHVSGRAQLLKHTARVMVDPHYLSTKPFFFCFVRNPLTWYESWFKYMEQPDKQWMHWGKDGNVVSGWHPNQMLNGLGGGVSFPEFVQNVNRKRPGYVTEFYGWYTRPPMNFIGRQEDLADDYIKLMQAMNVDHDEDFIRNYGKVGASPEPKDELVWPEGLKKQTALLEYAGMVRHGYQDTLKELGIEVHPEV